MQRNSILIILFLMLSTASCVPILSQMSDEEAWSDYFKEIKMHQLREDRTLASAAKTEIPEVRSGVKILRQILEGMPLRDYLISCDNHDCYQSQLVIAFDQAFRRVKDQNIVISAEEYTSEQKLFLELYSYEKILNWVEMFHRMLLSGVELRTAQRAVDLAHLCESSLDSEREVQLNNFSPYLGGLTYLPHSFYSCLNDHWQEELDQLLKETTDRLGINIKTNEAKRWILHRQIAPIYHKTLNDVFTKKKQEENARWLQAWSDTEKNINWKQSLTELIKNETPALRKQFHFLNLEAILTERKLSKK